MSSRSGSGRPGAGPAGRQATVSALLGLLGLLGLVGLWGCASATPPRFARLDSWPQRQDQGQSQEHTCAGLLGRGAAPEELGFSLAEVAPGVPQEPAALEALIATHAGAATEAVALAETPAAAEELDPKRLVGVPRCNGIARAWLWHEAGTGRLKGLWPGANVRIGLGRAEALFAQGRFPEARAALAAARKAPAGLHQAPLFELAIAESYARQEREEEARLVLGVVLGRHPSNADAWAELAALARRVGRRSEGAGHLVRALALEPGSPRLWDALRGDFFVSIEPAVLPPAQPADGDPSASRWQRVLDGADPAAAAAPESEALAYARCKSAFRQSPELRQAITGQAEPRWLWSPAEETVCTRLWLARYRENRDAGQRPPHPRLEALLEVELRGQLAERALFDVGGQVHRHLSAFLDRGRRERLFQFVENERLGRRQGGGWLF